jgi:hypothetical protein
MTLERDELDHWAVNVEHRTIIENFLDWCDLKRLELTSYHDGSNPRVQELLDCYHNIDRKRLEAQRRALVESL